MKLLAELRCRVLRCYPHGWRQFEEGKEKPDWVHWTEGWSFVRVPRGRRLWWFRTDIDGHALRDYGPPRFARMRPGTLEQFKTNVTQWWACPVCWIVFPWQRWRERRQFKKDKKKRKARERRERCNKMPNWSTFRSNIPGTFAYLAPGEDVGGLCDRTFAACKRLGNQARFGGRPGVGSEPKPIPCPFTLGDPRCGWALLS